MEEEQRKLLFLSGWLKFLEKREACEAILKGEREEEEEEKEEEEEEERGGRQERKEKEKEKNKERQEKEEKEKGEPSIYALSASFAPYLVSLLSCISFPLLSPPYPSSGTVLWLTFFPRPTPPPWSLILPSRSFMLN